MSLLVDYSFNRPDPARIAAAGYVGALRYLSHDPSKNLTPAEADALHAAGLSIGLVWETTAGRATQGAAAGAADVAAAEGQARALGYPAGCPIFYAVDVDVPASYVTGYFQGVTASATYPVGVYASAGICDVTTVPWRWQAAGWSGGHLSAAAHIVQRTGTPAIPGTDEDAVVKPVPLWSGLQGAHGAGVPGTAATTINPTSTPGVTMPVLDTQDLTAISSVVLDLFRAPEIAQRIAAAAQNGVWTASFTKAGVGPAAASDWLTDTRVLTGTLLEQLTATHDALTALQTATSAPAPAGSVDVPALVAAAVQAFTSVLESAHLSVPAPAGTLPAPIAP